MTARDLPCGCTREYTTAEDGTTDERTMHTYRCTSTRVLRLDRAGVRAAQRDLARARARMAYLWLDGPAI